MKQGEKREKHLQLDSKQEYRLVAGINSNRVVRVNIPAARKAMRKAMEIRKEKREKEKSLNSEYLIRLQEIMKYLQCKL